MFSTTEDLKAALKAYAREVGLDAVGVASAEPFRREAEILAVRGAHPFEHQNIAERVEPERLLPGVKAIIAGAVSYHVREPPPPADGLARGSLSNYCRGEDYHLYLDRKLRLVAAWLEEVLPGTRTQVYVDTGPPVDRAVAERAGLGKLGKSTNLIVPRLGTLVFLGEILTDAPLPPDAPLDAWNVCGSCTRCLDACPTSCLTPWQLDTDRCLAYTTQMDGAIPRELRAPTGGLLFGCDVCQDVCPYNGAALVDLHAAFKPLPGVEAAPGLEALLAMDAATFDRVYGPTAASWRGLETLQRNAVVALGNMGGEDAIELLTATLERPEAILRAHATWAIARLAERHPALTSRARDALTRHLAGETDAEACQETASALETLG